MAPFVARSVESLTDVSPGLDIPNPVPMPGWDGGMSLVYEEELEEYFESPRLCNARAPKYPHAPVVATLVAVGDPRYRPIDDIIASVDHEVPQVKIFAFHLSQDVAGGETSNDGEPGHRLLRTLDLASPAPTLRPYQVERH